MLLQNFKPLPFVYSWLENVSLLDLLINSLNYQFFLILWNLPVRERDKEKQDFICSLYFYLQTENVNRFRRAFRKHLNIYEEAFCENSDQLHLKKVHKTNTTNNDVNNSKKRILSFEAYQTIGSKDHRKMHNTIHNQDPRHQSNSGAREDPGIPEDYWVSVHLDQPSVHLFKSE